MRTPKPRTPGPDPLTASHAPDPKTLPEAPQHTTNLVASLQQRLREACWEKRHASADDELGLHFGERPSRNEKVAEVIAEGTGMALGDVRRDRDGRPSQLVHEPVTLMLGKLLSRAIRCFGQVHRLLPDSKVAVAPHWGRYRTGLGH